VYIVENTKLKNNILSNKVTPVLEVQVWQMTRRKKGLKNHVKKQKSNKI